MTEPKTTRQDLDRLEAMSDSYETGEDHDRDEHFASLLRFFHKRMSGHPLVAAGVNLAWELVLYDLSKGIDGYTSEPIRCQAAGLPPACYAIYRLRLPEIAEKCFSPELAAEVVAVRKQLEANP